MDQTKARALAFEIDAANRIVCAYTGYAVQRDFSLPPKEDAFHKEIVGETLFPKSKSSQELGADIHNILLARIPVNSARGNKPFAEVPSDEVMVWYWDDRESSSAPTGLEDCAKLGEHGFEPRDVAKGRVARSMFYVYMMYRDRVNKRYFEQQQETLRKWHQQYPATVAEVERSRRIASSAQGNPNPFVLDPTLIDRMYLPEVSAQSGQEPVWEAFEFDVAVLVELQTMEVDVASIGFEETEASSPFELTPFDFEVVTIRKLQSIDQMTPAEILAYVDQAVLRGRGARMSNAERALVEKAIEEQSYEKIAQSTGYPVSHLQTAGVHLFDVLSKKFEVKVTKRNFRAMLAKQILNSSFDRQQQQGQQCIERLGDRITLEMVAMPTGQFRMGAPKQEIGNSNSERPQHTVNLQFFLMGKYPVTQAQWRVVVALPAINRELNPDPSRFKGDDLPVERVSWWEAVEFCDRLSRKTGKPYRLPSEAEWEYACRAGTMTPFHFGGTITADLANYNGNYTYGVAPKGIYRKRTTPVGSFGVANDFGLYDMHGNVWEWCADHWHDNYRGAPEDGSAWLSQDENAPRLLRGSSWEDDPWLCRSANRYKSNPKIRKNIYGFRLACSYPTKSL